MFINISIISIHFYHFSGVSPLHQINGNQMVRHALPQVGAVQTDEEDELLEREGNANGD